MWQEFTQIRESKPSVHPGNDKDSAASTDDQSRHGPSDTAFLSTAYESVVPKKQKSTDLMTSGFIYNPADIQFELAQTRRLYQVCGSMCGFTSCHVHHPRSRLLLIDAQYKT